ncbi:MAG: sulfatase-like hydrolase/transferase [Bryobacterales bacterium]|nr:sulfatase-like hydrolase/transferase [Bryobacterales bacterium]
MALDPALRRSSELTFVEPVIAPGVSGGRRSVADARGGARADVLLLLRRQLGGAPCLGAGRPVAKTPHFDRLCREGVLFRHAFAPNPSCSPSRSSLLTGRETHRLREAASLYGTLDADFPRYPQALEKAGYTMRFAGKGSGPGTAAPEPGRG